MDHRLCAFHPLVEARVGGAHNVVNSAQGIFVLAASARNHIHVLAAVRYGTPLMLWATVKLSKSFKTNRIL
jgi:hypothetical protein